MNPQGISARSLVFAPQFGTQSKPRDFVSFQGWGRAFLAYHGVGKDRLVIIDNAQRPRAMRAATIKAIDAAAGIRRDGYPDVVAWCCHGYTQRIQLGFNSSTLRLLAEAIATTYSQDVRVVLYACSSGGGPGHSGDGGFADLLRDALCRAGALYCQVDAHVTAGRADANPFARRFDGTGTYEGGDGGYYLVNRTLLDDKGRKYINPLWPKWVKALRGDMRWRLATETTAEIRAEIEG